ncbi:MAG: efflux RND transporter periplasmic adaptor subunit [Cyanobacteria bacterium P01_G01_bin.67]
MEQDQFPRQTKSLIEPSVKIKLSKWQLIIITGVILGLGFWLGQSTQSPPTSLAQSVENKTQGNILPVATTKLEPVQSYQTTQTYTGEVKASRSSEVGFERGGKLVAVLVDEGDRLDTGMPLAKLDTANLEAEKKALVAQKAQAQAVLAELKNGARSEQITAAQASVRDLEQQLALEKLKSSRREYLYQEGAIAREQLDEIAFNRKALQERLTNAQSNLAELNNGTRVEKIIAQQAAIEALNAEINNLDISIAKSVLKSPFSGIVASRNLDEGVVVDMGQSILRVVEDVDPEVKIGIPSTLSRQVPPGSKQEVEVGKQTYQAIVSSILPEVDAATRTRTVVLRLPPTARNKVAPEQIARLSVTQNSHTDGYWLPINALVKGDKGLWSCFAIVDSNNDNPEVERRHIELLETREDRVLVTGTLKPGDLIITDGAHRLVPGQVVQLTAS